MDVRSGCDAIRMSSRFDQDLEKTVEAWVSVAATLRDTGQSAEEWEKEEEGFRTQLKQVLSLNLRNGVRCMGAMFVEFLKAMPELVWSGFKCGLIAATILLATAVGFHCWKFMNAFEVFQKDFYVLASELSKDEDLVRRARDRIVPLEVHREDTAGETIGRFSPADEIVPQSSR